MRTKLLLCLAFVAVSFSSCLKHASDLVPGYGEILNTWTFANDNNNYFGKFQSNAILHSTPQSNNTYLLEMTGTERATGQILTMAISLTEPNLTTSTFQSGVNGSDHATAFYYSGSTASRDAIYTSSNNSPGAIMDYTILHYDADKQIATISFKGEAFDAAGNKTSITRGRLTAKIDIQ